MQRFAAMFRGNMEEVDEELVDASTLPSRRQRRPARSASRPDEPTFEFDKHIELDKYAEMPFMEIPARSLRPTPFNQEIAGEYVVMSDYVPNNAMLWVSVIFMFEMVAFMLVAMYTMNSTSQINLKVFMLVTVFVGGITFSVFVGLMILYFRRFSEMDDDRIYDLITPIMLCFVGGFYSFIQLNSIKTDAGFDYRSYSAFDAARFNMALTVLIVSFFVGVLYAPRMVLAHLIPLKRGKSAKIVFLDADEITALMKRNDVEKRMEGVGQRAYTRKGFLPQEQ